MLGAFGQLTAEEQINQTAAGYLHTYFLALDLDLLALAQWPTDEDIGAAAVKAFSEANDLLSVLGIDCQVMLKGYCEPPPPKPRARKDVSASSGPRPPQTLAELIALYQYKPIAKQLPPYVKDEVEACKAALIADGIDCTLQVYVSALMYLHCSVS